jgi:hypothetical protein
VIERWPAVHRRRRSDIDQGMIDFGQRQAQVTDLARLVCQRFSFVNGAEELGERQRGAKTDGDKPRVKPGEIVGATFLVTPKVWLAMSSK